MFTGIGGFELGIQSACNQQLAQIEQNRQRGDGSLDKVGNDVLPTSWGTPLCVGYSEIDAHAIQTYEDRFGKETKNYGDATKINTADLPDFDLLVGGFPCQAFSIAGKRMGFDDTRGTLFFDVARVLRDKRPRYFVLENVKGLLSHDGGKTLSTILEVLTDTGYDVSWSIHNSKNYGVPQNRERIYIIGNLRGERRPEVFPIAEPATDGAQPNKDEEAVVSGALTARMFANWSGNHIAQINEPVHSNDRVYSPEGISPTLNTMQGGRRQPLIALSGNGADTRA